MSSYNHKIHERLRGWWEWIFQEKVKNGNLDVKKLVNQPGHTRLYNTIPELEGKGFWNKRLCLYFTKYNNKTFLRKKCRSTRSPSRCARDFKKIIYKDHLFDDSQKYIWKGKTKIRNKNKGIIPCGELMYGDIILEIKVEGAKWCTKKLSN